MFTGIIEELATILSKDETSLIIRISPSLRLSLGDSISVNGVCLTVVSTSNDKFKVELMPETWRLTNLGDLKIGDKVNLERALKADGRFGGHIVQGHIDYLSTIKSVTKEGNSWIISFILQPEFKKYIVRKGSIAINGISLTVMNIHEDYFTIGIIPYTWKNTVLSSLKEGNKVNIETDIMSRYMIDNQSLWNNQN